MRLKISGFLKASGRLSNGVLLSSLRLKVYPPTKKYLGYLIAPPPPFVLPATKLLAFKAFTLWYPRVCHKTFELTFGNLSSLSNISGVFCSLHNVKYTGLALAGIGTSYSFCAYALSFIYTPTVSELPTLVLPTHLHLGSPTEYQVM